MLRNKKVWFLFLGIFLILILLFCCWWFQTPPENSNEEQTPWFQYDNPKISAPEENELSFDPEEESVELESNLSNTFPKENSTTNKLFVIEQTPPTILVPINDKQNEPLLITGADEQSFAPIEDVSIPETWTQRLVPYQPVEELPTPLPYNGSISKFQALCLSVAEELFPRTVWFQTRPKWFQNPLTRRPLEIDIYTHHLEGRDIRLGIECHGAQHHCFPNGFHKTEAEFYKQRKRDQIKLELCRKRNIIILIIWYYHNSYETIRNELIEQLKIYKILPPGVTE